MNMKNLKYMMLLAMFVLSMVPVMADSPEDRPLVWSDWTAGFIGSDPTQGGDFYIYHPNTKKFFKTNGNRPSSSSITHDFNAMTMTGYQDDYGDPLGYWTVTKSGSDFWLKSGAYYFYIERSLGEYVKLSANTQEISIVKSGSYYKIYLTWKTLIGSREYRYFTYVCDKSRDGFLEFSDSRAKNANANNDWQFISKKEYESTFPYFYNVTVTSNLPAAQSSVFLAETVNPIVQTPISFNVRRTSSNLNDEPYVAPNKKVYFDCTFDTTGTNYLFLGWVNATTGEYVYGDLRGGFINTLTSSSHDSNQPTQIVLKAIFEDMSTPPVEVEDDEDGVIYYWRKNAVNDNWHNKVNWLVYNEDGQKNWRQAKREPYEGVKVHIPEVESGHPYPVIEGTGTCGMIYLEAGARLGHQERLKYNKAFLDLKVNEDRWVRMCSPLQNICTGDFVTMEQGADTKKTFEGTTLGASFSRLRNATYQSVFADATPFYTPYGFGGTEFVAESETSNWSEPVNILSYAYPMGVGYDIWMSNDNDRNGEVLLHFPSAVDTYYYYYENGERSEFSESVSHANSNKFAFTGNTTITLQHTNKGASSKMFAVGNPSVAYLDIAAFLGGNSGITKYLYRQEQSYASRGTEKIYYYDSGNKKLYIVNGSVSETNTPSGSQTQVSSASKDAYINVAEGFRVMSNTQNSLSLTYSPNMFVANIPATPKAAAPRKVKPETYSNVAVLSATTQHGMASTLLVLQNDASVDYSADEDAPLYDVEETGACFATLAGTQLVGVNVFDEVDTIPLFLSTSATLAFENIEALGEEVSLYDAVTGVATPLTNGMEYEAEVEDGQAIGRYYICHIAVKEETETALDDMHLSPLAYSPAKGALLVNTCSAEPMSINVYNTIGTLIASANGVQGMCSFAGLESGTYLITLNNTTDVKTLKVVVY